MEHGIWLCLRSVDGALTMDKYYQATGHYLTDDGEAWFVVVIDDTGNEFHVLQDHVQLQLER